MSGGHGHTLFVDARGPLHGLPPHVKVVAAVLLILAFVATPREAIWAYAGHAALVLVLVRLARLPFRVFARRLTIEAPFILFALFLPIVGGGEKTDVLGVALSVEGLWAAWNIVVKATLGLGVTLVLGATTEVGQILHGLDRLRIPRPFTAIAGFMVRYADVIGGEMQRMRIARASRGQNARWLWQAQAVATSAGHLFVRAYERGERVYLAMLARGYTGSMPVLDGGGAAARQWVAALAAPALAALVAGTAWVLRP